MFFGIPNVITYAVNNFSTNHSVYADLLRLGFPVIVIESKDLYTKPAPVSPPAGYKLQGDSNDLLGPLCISTDYLESSTLIISYGNAAHLAADCLEKLLVEEELAATLLVLQAISPLPIQALGKHLRSHSKILIVEEGSGDGGLASMIVGALNELGMPEKTIGLVTGISDVGANLFGENYATVSVENIKRKFLELVSLK